MFEWLRTHVIAQQDAELLYFIAQSILMIIAIGALLYARAQVSELKKSSEMVARQALVNSLLSLEQRWNSDHMREARKSIIELSGKLRESFSAALKLE
jgi:hypothetical protein